MYCYLYNFKALFALIKHVGDVVNDLLSNWSNWLHGISLALYCNSVVSVMNMLCQGSAEVLVEQRGGVKEGFGKGRKVHMTFGQLIEQLRQSSDSLYLTTQEVSTS